MTQTNAGGSVLSEHPVELAVAAAVGAVVAAIVVVSLLGGVRSVSDEPPIRVRNGSVDMRLQGGQWAQVSNNDKKNWKIDGEPDRGRDDFEVHIWGAAAAQCADSITSGNPVTFTVQNGTSGGQDKIEIKSTGRKTRVKVDNNDLADDDNLINLAGDGWFIREIKVGNAVKCTLSQKSATLRVALLDPDE